MRGTVWWAAGATTWWAAGATALSVVACRSADDLAVVDPDAALDAGALHDGAFALTSIGPRQVATPEEEQARAWIEAELRRIGLTDVVSEPFVFDAWRPGTASVQVDREVLVEALSPSPATELTVRLADASTGYAGAALLLPSTDGSRAEAFLTAIAGGAAALIRVTEEIDFDGSPLVEVGHLVDGTGLPAVAVDRGTGAWLADKLGQDVTLRIAPQVAVDHTSYNVVGRIPARDGSVEPGRVYVVAHYDSWHPSESAFDNALGAAGLVRLAERALAAGTEPDRELVFLATSGEEQGLRGSSAWVAAHAGELGPADWVLVLDVMWSGEGSYLALGTDPGLRTDAIDAAAAEGLDAGDGG
ncbi:MAG: M28 family peptidase, partial [Myxococcota bacterium]